MTVTYKTSLNVLHNLYIIIYTVLQTCSLFWNLCFVLHFVLLFCMLTIDSAATSVCVVCTVKKISPSEMKFFSHLIIVIVSVFHLCYVVTVVYSGDSCCHSKDIFLSRILNIASSFECMRLSL
jgi:hypothetical protein